MIWFLVPVMRNARNFDEGIILCVDYVKIYQLTCHQPCISYKLDRRTLQRTIINLEKCVCYVK